VHAESIDDASGVISFIGIGSNQGDPAARCNEAFSRLSQAGGIKLLRKSLLYRSEPVGFKEQDWFINVAAEIRTRLDPHGFLAELQGIENSMGRVRGEKWGPRVIDLDILLYGQEIIEDDDLIIPHPELHRRRFMLEPLFELAPYAIHPVFGISVRGLMERLEDGSKVYPYRAGKKQCLA